jgi:sulfopyruvate decarboxylase TPP-binding subunit
MDGTTVVNGLVEGGISHVIWIPDSHSGAWDTELSSASHITLIRVCREGEAFALAAGLYLGGKSPLVLIQCTGMFEAGDSLRNFIHDLKLPLVIMVGWRNFYRYREGTTTDTAPGFVEPILKAWQMPYVLIEQTATAHEIAEAYRRFVTQKQAGAILIAE